VGWDGQPELPPTAEEMEAENAPSQEEPAAATEMAFMTMEPSSQETIIDNSTYQDPGYESLPGGEEPAEDQNFATPTEGAYMTEGAGDIPQDMPAAESVESPDSAGSASADAFGGAGDPAAASAEGVTDAVNAGEVPNESAVDENYDFTRPLDTNAPAPEAESTADQPGFQDVTEFANASAGAGPLTYTLKIQGIDTGKIYGALKEALSDSRLGWDVQEVVKEIQNGTLQIRGLNPAKAFVVVNRIKYLSLKVSWRQDVLAAP
jgi:hypothetical protein